MKSTLAKWIREFKEKKDFRKVFLLAFYAALVLFRILYRDFRLLFGSKAAIVDLVKKEGIGIIVASIDDIEDVLTKITREEYDIMQNDIVLFCDHIIAGEYIHNAIKEVETMLLS